MLKILGLLLLALGGIGSNIDLLRQVEVFSLNAFNSGKESIVYARDLVERAPLYLSRNPLLQNRHWNIEKSIYEEYEFQEWELHAYLLAKSVSVRPKVSQKKCEELISGALWLSYFDIRVLKGDAASGYFQKNAKFVIVQNNEISAESSDLYVIDCPEQSTVVIFAKH
jgi:hypothetical protein